jgi:hypothetical protein
VERVRARAAIGAPSRAHLHVNVLSRLLGLLLVALPLVWLLQTALQRLPVRIELDVVFERKDGVDFQVSWDQTQGRILHDERITATGPMILRYDLAPGTSWFRFDPPPGTAEFRIRSIRVRRLLELARWDGQRGFDGWEPRSHITRFEPGADGLHVLAAGADPHFAHMSLKPTLEAGLARERSVAFGSVFVLVLVALTASLGGRATTWRYLLALPRRGVYAVVRLGSPSAPVAGQQRSYVGPLVATVVVGLLLVPICACLTRTLQYRAGLAPVTGSFFYLSVTIGVLGVVAALAFLVRVWSTRVLAPRLATICASAFVFFVLGALLHVVALQPYRALVAQMYIAAWGGVFGLWLFAHPGLVRAVGEGRSRIIGLVLIQLCAVTVLLEGALRLVAIVRPSPVFAMPQSGAREFLRMNRNPPGTVIWGMPTNSLGHFDEEFAMRGEAPLVAAIGDSFSYGIVPHALHFTTVCEQLVPPVQVANFGLPAIGPPEYLELLVEEALPLRPDLIVINVFVGNDFERGPAHARNVPPWRRVLDGELLYLSVVTPRLLVLARQDRDMRGKLGQVATPGTDSPQRTSLEVLLQQVPWLQDHTLEPASFSEAAFLATESSRAQNLCSDPGSSLETFYSNFERIIAAAGDIPVAVLLIPDEFQVEEPLWDEVTRTLSHLQLDRFRPQRMVTAWLAEKGIPYEDVLPRLRALPLHDDGQRHAYRKRDTHFNAVGCRVAGEALAALVSRVLGLPTSTNPTIQQVPGPK